MNVIRQADDAKTFKLIVSTILTYQQKQLGKTKTVSENVNSYDS